MSKKVIMKNLFFCSKRRGWFKRHCYWGNHSPETGSDEWERGQVTTAGRCGEAERAHPRTEPPAEGCQGGGGEPEGQSTCPWRGHGQNGAGQTAAADAWGQGHWLVLLRPLWLLVTYKLSLFL